MADNHDDQSTQFSDNMTDEEFNDKYGKYSSNYSEDSFWDKVKKNGSKFGGELLEKAVTMFYCAIDPNTPMASKALIFIALGYLISPFDLIPDFIPIIGYSDDLLAVATAYLKLTNCITPEHKQKAHDLIASWFGEDFLKNSNNNPNQKA